MTFSQLLGLACLLLIVWSFFQAVILTARKATTAELHHSLGPVVGVWMILSVLLATVALVG